MRAKARLRVGMVIVFAVTVIGTLPVVNAHDRSKNAARSKVCAIAPFSPTIGATFAETLPDDRYRVEYRASGTSTLDCPTLGVLGIDVWEHAYYLKFVGSANSNTYLIRGKLNVTVATGDLNGDGAPDVRTLLTRVRGSASCADDVCQIAYTGRDGNDDIVLKLHHRGTLDVRGEEWRDHEVDGVYRPANAIWF